MVSREKIRSTAATGSTITLPTTKADMLLLLDHSATVAALTVVFPPAPMDGQEVGIAARSNITALTLSMNSVPMTGPVSSMSANNFAWWIYDATGNRWFRFK